MQLFVTSLVVAEILCVLVKIVLLILYHIKGVKNKPKRNLPKVW